MSWFVGIYAAGILVSSFFEFRFQYRHAQRRDWGAAVMAGVIWPVFVYAMAANTIVWLAEREKAG